MKEETVEVNGEKIVFFVQRKKIKNINLKVNVDGKITISMPMRMKIEAAKDFIRLKIEWIKKHQNLYENNLVLKESVNFEEGEILYLLGKQYKIKLLKGKENNVIINDQTIEIQIKDKYINNKKYIKQYYDKWLKDYALIIYKKLVEEYQKKLEKYDIIMPKIEVRQMKARWGSCCPSKNKVTFNLSLIKTPIECVEYVVLHELSHLKYHDHSKNFYNFISIFMPEWKERRRKLNNYL